MLPEQQQRIMGYFIEEAKDHLVTIEQGLLDLQATIEDSEKANEIFRAAHSVKGGAAMLGLESIQKTAHRMEDYFKLLKESAIQVDSALETMFLMISDGLKDLIDQLEAPSGFTDENAQKIMAKIDPVFAQIDSQLSALIANNLPNSIDPHESISRDTVADADVIPASFRQDVTALLRQMLTLFKQPDSSESRKSLQAVCSQLTALGERVGLSDWCDLLETARIATTNLENEYRTLAPALIKEIKNAQDLVLSGRSAEIVVSDTMRSLLPKDTLTPDTLPTDTLTTELVAEPLGDEFDQPSQVFLEAQAELSISENLSVQTFAEAQADDTFELNLELSSELSVDQLLDEDLVERDTLFEEDSFEEDSSSTANNLLSEDSLIETENDDSFDSLFDSLFDPLSTIEIEGEALLETGVDTFLEQIGSKEQPPHKISKSSDDFFEDDTSTDEDSTQVEELLEEYGSQSIEGDDWLNNFEVDSADTYNASHTVAKPQTRDTKAGVSDLDIELDSDGLDIKGEATGVELGAKVTTVEEDFINLFSYAENVVDPEELENDPSNDRGLLLEELLEFEEAFEKDIADAGMEEAEDVGEDGFLETNLEETLEAKTLEAKLSEEIESAEAEPSEAESAEAESLAIDCSDDCSDSNSLEGDRIEAVPLAGEQTMSAAALDDMLSVDELEPSTAEPVADEKPATIPIVGADTFDLVSGSEDDEESRENSEDESFSNDLDHDFSDDFSDLERLLDVEEDVEEEVEEDVEEEPQLSANPLPPARVIQRATSTHEQNMRVPVQQLDNLSNLVGELVVSRNTFERDQERLRRFLNNLMSQVQQLNDIGQQMRDLYERSLLESSLGTRQKSYATVGNGVSPTSSTSPTVESHATGAIFDSLEMDRFTGFHTLSHEMIELIVRVRESASDIGYTVESSDQVKRQFRQITTQLQEGLNTARMVPFSHASARLPRAVRDISVQCGKAATLAIEGEDTLIDKMIVERLYDPLTHLVNNAIAHGIEPPEQRAAVGKPREGTITISASYQGNQTLIYVSDDGRGIDPDFVKRKAIEKELITQTEAEELSAVETYGLLFQPGFSTRDQADDFAGRGVGMDVVQTALAEIHGVVSIDSEPGSGTRFTIRLPLTLSISRALSCVSKQARIAFPMDGIEDMLDVERDRLVKNDEDQDCISWRESLLPVYPIAELLTFNRMLGRGQVYGGSYDDEVLPIIVLRSANTYVAIQVDQVLGEEEIVFKPLEGPVPKPLGIAGATILGDGRVMPIADVLELIDMATGRIRREPLSLLGLKSAATTEEAATKNDPTVLIVDDSVTVRELLSMSFSKVGYRVEQARDGREAWEKLRSGLPCDLVFCDVEMPRMDGLTLLSRMQKDAVLRQIPIAILTSRGADRHRQLALDLGASGYFTKPYLEEALLDAAQRMLDGESLEKGRGG